MNEKQLSKNATRNSPKIHTLSYGQQQLRYQVLRRKRKTLEIAVLPTQEVQVVAPLDAAEELIAAKVQKRASWIIKQQKWFRKLGPRTPERSYVSGETHLYLGRHYRLQLMMQSQQVGEQEKECKVSLQRGHFVVRLSPECISSENRGDYTVVVKRLMDLWYRIHAQKIFRQILQKQCIRYVISEVPALQIRIMQGRWGSLSAAGRLTLNLRLVQAPRECIEYVITHELCHLVHSNHSPDFYKLLQKRQPDWQIRKQKLETFMV
jgi:predicted metal-dependent hydrolase